MTINPEQVRHFLRTFDLPGLFLEELGWDHFERNWPIEIENDRFVLEGCAQKRGVKVFTCRPEAGGSIPAYSIRQKIERHVRKHEHEHLIVFIDDPATTQTWQWVAREPGRPARYRELTLSPQIQSGDRLIQLLDSIAFTLSEEESIDLFLVTQRLQDAVPRETVTKKFYRQFETEHAAFLEFIEGITAQGDRAWYASLMLNRLMFVYFIQKKRFLAGDPNYLRNRLKWVQERRGKGKFHSFYRYFLLCLFHQGFAKQPEQREIDPDLAELLGHVPYLNGGLFDVHELEAGGADEIDIPDEAFENLFAFFDEWEWHLDDRPLQDGRHINPDVLGYIFEQYINNKQMGAYYTKEDITGYISRNTIIPFLLDSACDRCPDEFQPDSPVWRLLQDNPDSYIYPAVRHGVIDEHGEVIPLPDEIAAGVDDVSQREGWNRAAAAGYGLPTETWREHVARRQRCLNLREKLLAGEIHQVNDLITYNLDIQQFAQDVIETCTSPELLQTIYRSIAGHLPEQSNEKPVPALSVLDPTCGSGAFLFAALHILHPLYEACLARMAQYEACLARMAHFVQENGAAKKRRTPVARFRQVLEEVARHPSTDYFILKSIIVGNLYGVDIMAEAVEICKLRLFLTLVARVEPDPRHENLGLEPLPDIDFNIRPGNTLVGFVTLDEIRDAVESERGGGYRQHLLVDSVEDSIVREIEEDAEVVEQAFGRFHQMQTTHGMDGAEFTAQKLELRQRLQQLTDRLDAFLATEYGENPQEPEEYAAWRESHQPFHWFAEFYGIMHRGGFDVIIGNPPLFGEEEDKLSNIVTAAAIPRHICQCPYSE